MGILVDQVDMNYQEKKITKIIDKGQGDFIEHNFEYKCEDLFGEATITSINKLDGETLDELVCDIIMAKQLKKGHTPNYEIDFQAKFKSQWKDDEDNNIINNNKPMKKLNKKNKITAILLCFFLGGIGFHRFYLGKIGTGLLMLITFGGFGIWTLIDFVILLTMSDEDFEEKYN